MSFEYLPTKDERIKLVGDVYHARFSCRGQRVQKSLETSNFKVAVQLVEDIQNAILLGENWRQDKALFNDIFDPFLEAKAKGKQRGKKVRKVGEKTLKEYIHFIERWYKPFFGHTRIDKLTGELWDEYLEYVRAHSRSGRKTKMKNHWMYMSGIMTWARAVGHIRVMPDIYNPDEVDEDGAGKNYTDDELKRLRDGGIGVGGMEVAPPKPTVRLWIYIAQFMGMRSFEISQLPKERIDLVAGLIRLRREAKGGRPRSIPIHPAVVEMLKVQMIASGASPYLFPNAWDSERPMDVGGFQKPWTQLRQDLGIEGRFHDFRHSYATRAFANPDLNPVVVCSALGMSMSVAMKVYIHFDENQLRRITAGFALGEGIGK